MLPSRDSLPHVSFAYHAGQLLLAFGLILLAEAIAGRNLLHGFIAAALLLLCALAFLYGKDRWDRSL